MHLRLRDGQQPVTVVVTYGRTPTHKRFVPAWRTIFLILASLAIITPALAAVALGLLAEDFVPLRTYVTEAIAFVQVIVKALAPSTP